MQIPKVSLLICAVALSGSLTLCAQDTPAQAAARAALLEKMNELQANPPAETTAPAPEAAAPVATPAAAGTVSVVRDRYRWSNEQNPDRRGRDPAAGYRRQPGNE